MNGPFDLSVHVSDYSHITDYSSYANLFISCVNQLVIKVFCLYLCTYQKGVLVRQTHARHACRWAVYFSILWRKSMKLIKIFQAYDGLIWFIIEIKTISFWFPIDNFYRLTNIYVDLTLFIPACIVTYWFNL